MGELFTDPYDPIRLVPTRQCLWNRGFPFLVRWTLPMWMKWGPSIMGRWPIERVELTNKWPWLGLSGRGLSAWWFDPSVPPGEANRERAAASQLPAPVMRCLPAGGFSGLNRMAWVTHGLYAHENAIDKAATACLAWATAEATKAAKPA